MHDHSGRFSTPLSVLMEQADKKNIKIREQI